MCFNATLLSGTGSPGPPGTRRAPGTLRGLHSRRRSCPGPAAAITAERPTCHREGSNHSGLFTDFSFSYCLIFQLEKVNRHASPSINAGREANIWQARSTSSCPRPRKCLRKGGKKK